MILFTLTDALLIAAVPLTLAVVLVGLSIIVIGRMRRGRT